MLTRHDRSAFAAAWLSLLVVLSVLVSFSARVAAATLHPARIANAQGDPDRFCSYFGADHLAELAAAGEPAAQSFAPASGAWARPFDLAGTSTIEQEMAAQLLVADNKERAARAVGSVGNPGNPAPQPFRANRALTLAAAHWANCLASAGATSDPDNPVFASDDLHAGFRGQVEAEVAFGLMSLGSPPDTGAVNVGYMQSAAHRDVILGPAYSQIGIAVACGPGGTCAEVEELGGPVRVGAHLAHWPENPIVVAPSGLSASTVLPGTPRIVNVSSLSHGSAGSCTVQWVAPAPGGYDRISSYTVTLSPTSVAGNDLTVSRGPLSRRLTVRGLAAGSYRVTVAAANDLGVSPSGSPSLDGSCLVAAAS